MRGADERQGEAMLALTPDDFVPDDHPIRQIKTIVGRALAALSPTFAAMYSPVGRRSIPPEHLLKASLLIALYSIRSERQFCERLRYDLLFKWFLDLNIGDRAFDHSTFSKNRQRLLDHKVAAEFFAQVVAEARRRELLSEEHFTVDGTLLEAWASLKSLRPREGSGDPPVEGGGSNPDIDFHGEKRSNATHVSTTDDEALLARKGPGKEAKLCFAGHLLMDNREGLVRDLAVTQATGTAEPEAAEKMLTGVVRGRRLTVGADKRYDEAEFVGTCRDLHITPHVARKARGSAIDGRTTRHVGYRLSQRVRKRVEEIFGWLKTVGGGRKLRYLGVKKNQLWAYLAAAAYNLVRMARLAAAVA
jgi:transposase